jgi:Concanavalin A-like lectin/glucanases superfamily
MARSSSMQRRTLALLGALLALLISEVAATPQPAPGDFYLQFDGLDDYVEVPDSDDFSVTATGGLTIAAWIKPDTLTLPSSEGSGYVHWLGKGEPQQHEWTFRMYSLDNAEGRENRISFYVFNRGGGLGIGSYFQDPVTPGEWIHVVGSLDSDRTYIYRNGILRDSDQYGGTIVPENGSAPLRMGKRDGPSHLHGGLGDLRVWNRSLTAGEVAALYAANTVPQDGLVAEWRLNEGVGRIARDTADGHDGNIIGATWTVEPKRRSPAEWTEERHAPGRATASLRVRSGTNAPMARRSSASSRCQRRHRPPVNGGAASVTARLT